MARLLTRMGLFLCLNCMIVIISYGQEDNYRLIINSIESKILILTGFKYDISGTDVDESKDDPDEHINDPYKTLSGCFIFLAADVTDPIATRPKGFIGIYNIKNDSIVWRSGLLSNDFSSGAMGSVDGTYELNRDGKVEIIIRQGKEPLGVDQLWIFGWDGITGTMITQQDHYDESTIMYAGGEFKLKDVDNDGIYEILGEWYRDLQAETKTTVIYSWNGSLYGKWGKSSKYLLKGVKK